MGEVEIEFEGTENFLRDELKELLSGVVDLHHTQGQKLPPLVALPAGSVSSAGSDSNFTGTTATVAARLGAKSGAELIIAAATRLALVLKQDTYSRSALLKEMQTATSYYKKGYGSNLSNYLKALVSEDKLREVSKDTYALSAAEIQHSKQKLVS